MCDQAADEKDRSRIYARLKPYYTREEAVQWMTSPHPQLEGQLPTKLITDGQTHLVDAVLDRLDADGYL